MRRAPIFTWRRTGAVLSGYLAYQGYVKYNTFVFEQKHTQEGVPLPVLFFKLLPLHISSSLFGWASQVEIPVFMRPFLYSLYMKTTGINPEKLVYCYDHKNERDRLELENTLKQYESLGSFFSRPYHRLEGRYYDSNHVSSPCDGKIMDFGVVGGWQNSRSLANIENTNHAVVASMDIGKKASISSNIDNNTNISQSMVPSGDPKTAERVRCDDIILSEVKGFRFSMGQFLNGIVPGSTGENSLPSSYIKNPNNQLYYCVIYLSPSDNHRFFSPVTSWTINSIRHIYGERLPVAPALLSSFRTSLALNERCSLQGEWDYGFFSMTPVGSINVGSIHLGCLNTDLPTSSKLLKANNISDKVTTTELNGQNRGILETIKTRISSLAGGDSEHYGSKFLSSRDLYIPSKPVSLKKYEHVGHFSMGSTIVLIFEAPEKFNFVIRANKDITAGETLGLVQ
jgi:phosphatidylserine decarboxylase